MLIYADMSTCSKNLSDHGEVFDLEWCRRQRWPSQNQVAMIAERERGHAKRGIRHCRNYRDIYSTVPLDRFVQIPEAKHMQDIIISWTPDGQRLIAFHTNLRVLHIYRYLGVEKAKSSTIDTICKSLLKLESEIMVQIGSTRLDNATLRYESLLFTDDDKHFVVATATPAPESLLTLQLTYPNNEALPLTNQSLEVYTFYAIDIQKGEICHYVMYTFDKINLTHGVSLSGRILMILSLQRQTIHIMRINEEGLFVPLKEIGPSVQDDDGLYLFSDMSSTFLRTSFTSGLKQRLNTFLYQRAKRQGRIAEFLRSAGYRSLLKIHRAQLFDVHFLLIRMMPHSGVRLDMNTMPCFFVILDWRTCEILEVFEKFGPRFLRFFENSVESLMHPLQRENHWPNTFQHNPYAHEVYRRARNRYGMTAEIYRRMLNILPYSSNQVSMSSPYLDSSLFIMDDKFHSNIITSRVRTDGGSVKVFCRRTSRFLFSLPLTNTSRQVTFLFHPTDPLALAFDRTRPENPIAVYLPGTPREQ